MNSTLPILRRSPKEVIETVDTAVDTLDFAYDSFISALNAIKNIAEKAEKNKKSVVNTVAGMKDGIENWNRLKKSLAIAMLDVRSSISLFSSDIHFNIYDVEKEIKTIAANPQFKETMGRSVERLERAMKDAWDT